MGIPRLNDFYNPAEIAKAVASEKAMQPYLDSSYRDLGYSLYRCATKGYDLRLTDGQGRSYDVEEKILKHSYREFAIEILQDIVTRDPGWFYTTRCQWLSYSMCDQGELSYVYILDWPEFKRWFVYVHLSDKQDRERYRGRYLIESRGKGLTLNLLVPLSYVPGDLYLHQYDAKKQLALF